jgi:Transglycosylase-like domain
LKRARGCGHRGHLKAIWRHDKRQFYEHRRQKRRDAAIDPPGEAVLYSIRSCESGGDYSIDTGNGFYGAYQFDLGTWGSVGGSGLPSDASPREQDERAAALYRERGPSPWPVCGFR